MRAEARVRGGGEQLRSLEEALVMNATDAEIITRNTDSVFREIETELFVSEGKSGGSPWPPVSSGPPGYYWERKQRASAGVRARNRKSKKGSAPSMERPISLKTMRWSENLMRSLTRYGHSEHFARALGFARKLVMELGTTNPLAWYHWNRYKGRPSRRVVQLTEEQKHRLLEPARTYKIQQMLAAFRNQARFGNARGVHR
jgi:hypothetical protein